jgi:predicted alpha/beta hydrolase family esterase
MQFIIFHGSFANVSTTHWFDGLKTELSSPVNQILIPQYPVDSYKEIDAIGEKDISTYTAKQSLASWMTTFEKDVLPQISRETIWIGHSMGNLLMLHVLEKYKMSLSGAIFVVPFYKKVLDAAWQFKVVNDSFYRDTFDFETLKKQIGFSYTLYSKNDPYVPNEDSLEFAYKIDSTTLPIQNGQHLGSKFKRLPLIEELAKSMVDYLELTSNENKNV